ncbi:MAG: hypothetical protein XD70_0317 [Thermovirga lienii]|nr:MAG: hypothetical protein XD70_0317 [Thermovirga lienii]
MTILDKNKISAIIKHRVSVCRNKRIRKGKTAERRWRKAKGLKPLKAMTARLPKIPK